MKNVKPVIRKAVLSDRAGLFPLLKDFSTSFSPEETAFDIAFENVLADDSAILLVALLENCLIGYCLGFDHYAFYANGRVSWVEELMVHEAFRKKAIGRALMISPSLLLIDEPSLGLSPLVVDEVERIIGGIKDSGVAVLMVEGNVDLIRDLPDIVYVLDHGNLVYSGTVSQIMNDANLSKSYFGM